MPRINQVVLVPDKKALKILGRFSEQEVIDAYCASIFEHLEEDRIEVRLANDLDPILPNSLVIHCLGGWDGGSGRSKTNVTSILYGDAISLPFAETIGETLGEWGRCYGDFHHRIVGPKENQEIFIKEIHTVAISPFRINGPNAESYMTKLDELGRTIAHAVMEYLISRSEQPKMMKVDYK